MSAEQIARQPGRCPREGEERPGRLLDREDAAPFLDQLHERVGGIQPELHGSILDEHMFALDSSCPP